MALLDVSHAPVLFDLTVSVVTLLFGGSSLPRVTDSRDPVRASSVRGHLRFWWRTCKASAYESADDLFKREEAVWGSTTVPSPVIITVETTKPGNEHVIALPETRNGRPRLTWTPGYMTLSYALFPFQGSLEQNILPTNGRTGVEFRLKIATASGLNTARRQEVAAEVQAALWAWFTFGGIGARTRRGCGTLYCADPLFTPPQGTVVERVTWLQTNMQRYGAAQPTDKTLPIPLLHGARVLLGTDLTGARQAWEQAVVPLRDYRQRPEVGRNKGQEPNRPGRSRWPEPDSIRHLEPSTSRRHQPEHRAEAYYPRADLGLPIIFHFKDRDDPGDGTLQAGSAGATRMASPIILKALATSSEQAVPLVLCLAAPHVWDERAPGIDLKVQSNSKSYRLVRANLHDPTKDALVAPLRDQGSAHGAREGFMRYAASTGHFTPVVQL